MAYAAKPLLKPVSMAVNGCETSLLSIFKASYSHPSISIPFRPIKLRISCSYATSIPLSLKRKDPILRVSVIAAQQEEDSPVLLEEQQGGGEFSWAEAPESGGGGDETMEPPEEARLFVGNVPYDVDSRSLAEIFSGAGTVDVVEVWSAELQ